MEFGSYKIPNFSENSADFQQWKFKFINLVGMRKLWHMISKVELANPCPSIPRKNATKKAKTLWKHEFGELYRKWKTDSEEIFHFLTDLLWIEYFSIYL